MTRFTDSARRVRLLLLAAAAVALVVLAAGLPNVQLGEGRALQVTVPAAAAGGGVPPVDPDLLYRLFMGFIIAMAALTAVALIFTWRQSLPDLLITALYVLLFAGTVYIFGRLANNAYVLEPLRDISTPLPSIDWENPPEIVADPGNGVALAITLGLVALLLGLLFRTLRQWSPRRPGSGGDLDLVADSTETALFNLHQGMAVSDAILRCYADMNRQLRQRHGLRRDDSMTPREFEAYLAGMNLPRAALQRLTQLFEQVRYGHAAAGERERREAVACLEEIVAAARRQRGVASQAVVGRRWL